MPLYKLVVAYDGTRFHGFQRQIDNAAMMAKSAARPRKRPQFDESDGTRKRCTMSVQEVLEMVILHDLYPSSSIASSNNNNNHPTTTTTIGEINLKFAGRTDRGVHARGQVVTIRLPVAENVWRLRQSINSRLPVDISVVQVELLTADLDPRRDVVEKRYSYTIKYQRCPRSWSNNNQQSSMIGGPLNSIRHALDDPPCLWVCPWALDDALLPKLLEQLQGTHDYSAFVHKEDRHAKNNTLTISIEFVVLETRTDYYEPTSTAEDDGNDKEAEAAAFPVDFVTARFDFKGKGFRRSMLRNLVGYSVDVCRGLDSVPSVERVFDSNSNNNGHSVAICAAPASGLCLESVTY